MPLKSGGIPHHSSKIYKMGTPLHPIVDYTGSMVYMTSTSIADVLKPLVAKMEYHIKNTTDFRKDISDLCVGNDEIMNSHEVVSMFTSDRLVKGKTLSKHMDISSDDIMNLLKFVMLRIYFQFEGGLHPWGTWFQWWWWWTCS